jgi:hypothetical protein
MQLNEECKDDLLLNDRNIGLWNSSLAQTFL